MGNCTGLNGECLTSLCRATKFSQSSSAQQNSEPVRQNMATTFFARFYALAIVILVRNFRLSMSLTIGPIYNYRSNLINWTVPFSSRAGSQQVWNLWSGPYIEPHLDSIVHIYLPLWGRSCVGSRKHTPRQTPAQGNFRPRKKDSAAQREVFPRESNFHKKRSFHVWTVRVLLLPRITSYQASKQCVKISNFSCLWYNALNLERMVWLVTRL